MKDIGSAQARARTLARSLLVNGISLVAQVAGQSPTSASDIDSDGTPSLYTDKESTSSNCRKWSMHIVPYCIVRPAQESVSSGVGRDRRAVGSWRRVELALVYVSVRTLPWGLLLVSPRVN